MEELLWFEKASFANVIKTRFLDGDKLMNSKYLDLYIAKHKMKLKNTNHCLSFVTTLWKGEVIMCCMNNLSREIVNAFCTQIISPEDLQTLEWLIQEFLFDSAYDSKGLT